MDEDEAQKLLDRGLVVQWNPDEHGAEPAEIAQRLVRREGQASQSSGVRHA